MELDGEAEDVTEEEEAVPSKYAASEVAQTGMRQ